MIETTLAVPRWLASLLQSDLLALFDGRMLAMLSLVIVVSAFAAAISRRA